MMTKWGNGMWLAKASRWKLIILGGDRIVYLAMGRLRLRIMKP